MSAKGSELKRVRQAKKANTYNKHYKSKMNSAISNLLTSPKKDAAKQFPEVVKLIDKVASKGVIHKNKAANQKSRITKHINNLK